MGSGYPSPAGVLLDLPADLCSKHVVLLHRLLVELNEVIRVLPEKRACVFVFLLDLPGDGSDIDLIVQQGFEPLGRQE